MRAPNIKSLIKDEMVKQFEGSIADEVRQYNLTVVSQNNELDCIKSLIENMLKEQKELTVNQLKSKSECLDAFSKEKDDLFLKNEEHRRFINEMVSILKKEVECVKEKSESFIKNTDLATCVVALNQHMARMEESAVLESKRLRELVEKEKQSILSQIDVDTKTLNFYKDFCDKQHEEQEKKIDVNSVDAKGVLRELQIHKKSVFIVEKKIENIYTQIERLQERILP